MNPFALNLPAARKNASIVRTPNLKEMDEISWSETDVIQSFVPYGNNPDPVVRLKGLKIYHEMLEDDQIKVCLDLRKQARLSTPWKILPGIEDNPLAAELSEFVTHNLKRMNGTFEDRLLKIYSAIDYGFSLTEIIYEIESAGRWEGKMVLKNLKTREPFQYDFKVDPHGNLLGLVYIGVKAEGSREGRRNPGSYFVPGLSYPQVSPSNKREDLSMGTASNPFPMEKFIVYSYNMEFGNWYGRSDLIPAFRHWNAKKHVIKFWNVWLERYASPFAWAQVKRDGGMKKEALSALDDFLKNLSVKSGIRTTDAVQMEFVQGTRQAGDAYELAVNSYNRYMAHALLFPNLLGFTDQQNVGSYSLGQKHFDAFNWVLEKMGRDTSETIVGEQIIKRVVDYNYPNVPEECYPKFVFEAVEDDIIKMRADILKVLRDAGMISPQEGWLRDFLTLPKLEDGIELPKSAQELAADAASAMGGNGNANGRPPFGKSQSMKPGQKPQQKPLPKGAQKPSTPQKAKPKNMHQTFAAKPRQVDEFERKMRVTQFKAEMEAADKALFDELMQNLTDSRDAMIEYVQRKKIIADGDSGMVKNVPFNVGEVKKTLHKWIVKVVLDSKVRVLDELNWAGAPILIVRKFALGGAPMEDWQPLPPSEAIDFFRRKVIAKTVDQNGKQKVIDITSGMDLTFLREKAFAIAGLMREDILGDAKQIILNGIKRQDETGAIKDLKNLFNKYIDQGIAVDGDLLEPSRLQTIVRTNISEAVNEGRASMMDDPDVGDFVQFWEYSAVLDDRTTEYCQCMDGLKFRKEDLPLLKPPAHYNCRSVVVPITKFEVEDLKKKGKGIEIDEACPGRMAAFDLPRREPLGIPPIEVVDIVNPPEQVPPSDDPNAPAPEIPDPPSDEVVEGQPDLNADRLRRQLEMVVVRCPYKGCNSPDIAFNKAIFNVGEFGCDTCGLPFRVSNAGDIYLYDAGIERWERVTQGMNPNFFQEMEADDPHVCPYRFCRSSEVKLEKAFSNIRQYACHECGLPFRVSKEGDHYLYDAGEGRWQKTRSGR